ALAAWQIDFPKRPAPREFAHAGHSAAARVASHLGASVGDQGNAQSRHVQYRRAHDAGEKNGAAGAARRHHGHAAERESAKPDSACLTYKSGPVAIWRESWHATGPVGAYGGARANDAIATAANRAESSQTQPRAVSDKS